MTGNTGQFHLTVTDGVHTLRVSAPGYASVERSGVEVEGGQITVLDEPFVLSGAPAALRGVVELQPGFEDEDRLSRARIELFAGDDETAAFSLSPAPSRPSPMAAPEGPFVFSDLASGDWRLRISLEGFFTDERGVHLPVGSETGLGVITLFADAPAILSGHAELADQPADGHGGTRVEALITPYVAMTTANGRWQLSVPAGAHALQFRREGYGTQQLTEIRAVTGIATEVDDVHLVGLPGTVRGSVAISEGFGRAEALRRVDVAVLRIGEVEPFAQTTPDARGAFTLPFVPPGDTR